jgi:hypothetical protein
MFRSRGYGPAGGQAHVAQLAEHLLGKEEVSGSSPDMGSNGHRGLRPFGASLGVIGSKKIRPIWEECSTHGEAEV